MTRFQWYLFKQLATGVSVIAIVLVFAIIMTQTLRLLDVVIDRGAPITVFLHLLLLALPNFLQAVVPIGSAVAVLFVYNRVAMDSELVVMRAAGIGPFNLAWPAISLGVIIVVLLLVLQGWVSPLANRELRQMQAEIAAGLSQYLLREGQFNAISDDLTIYFRDQRSDGLMSELLIHDTRTDGQTVTVAASEGWLRQQPDRYLLTLFNGSREIMRDGQNDPDLLFFGEYTVTVPIDRTAIEELPFKFTDRFVWELLTPDVTWGVQMWHYDRMIATGHERLAMPLTAIGFIVIACAFLLTGEHSRRGQNGRIALAVGCMVLLQSTMMVLVTEARGNLGLVPLLYVIPIGTVILSLTVTYMRPWLFGRVRKVRVAPRPSRERRVPALARPATEGVA